MLLGRRRPGSTPLHPVGAPREKYLRAPLAPRPRARSVLAAAPRRALRLKIRFVADIELPDDLIALERTSEEERAKLAALDDYDERQAQRDRCVEAAMAFQAAVAAHAEATGQSRLAVEMAAKRAVRHPEAKSAE